jgi:DNA invertase Pin-like site-specific DNA recombinase
MRAAIYARYSSTNQREASIEDQFEVGRRFIEKQGWKLVRTYEDRAMSGASRFRPGYQELLGDVPSKRFDVIVVEALDRLGRKLADVADLYDRLSFAGVKLYAVSSGGEITAMHIGLLGTMAQLYLADLREKTWRGQLGRALQGKAPGGKAYGYDVVSGGGEAGERRINDAEPAVVRRIFDEFAAGQSPRAIAKRLNAEHVAGPGGRPWGDTTIRGQVDRATGILNNALYVGRLEWNRCSYQKNPMTGKRVARPNPREKWEIAEVPELRIVDQALWDRVKARQQEVRIEMARDADGNALNRAHRRQFLLSGLLECGCCGGSYAVLTPGRYGCSTRRSKGTCSNTHMIDRAELENRVLAGLKERLMAPQLVEVFISEFRAELRRATQAAEGERVALTRANGEVDRKIAGILRAIEDGNYNPTLTKRLTALEAEKTEMEAKLGSLGPAPVIELHPNLPALYRHKVERLAEALGAHDTRVEAGEAIRSLISRVVLTPVEGQLEVRLYGDLAEIVAFSERGERKEKGPASGEAGPLLSVVAGTCNHLYRTAVWVPR